MDGSIVFARWCLPMWAHWRHLANTTELVLPSVHNPNRKSIGSAISALLTAESPYTLHKIASSHGGNLDPI